MKLLMILSVMGGGGSLEFDLNFTKCTDIQYSTHRRWEGTSDLERSE